MNTHPMRTNLFRPGLTLIRLLILVGLLVALAGITPEKPALAQAENPNPPEQIVKLIFIHHSTGENWLTDDYGNLGRTLAANNYFVSDTNYGWGPDGIGDRTDYPDWLEWFVGPESARYMEAVYTESGQNSNYSRPLADPGGENQIVMFKSCFPNSDLAGNPNDPAMDGEWFTVGHAKYVYNQLLNYFVTRPDKLFIVITQPPLLDPSHAENALAFTRWLTEDWLAENDYPYNNVAVWDFHNVLTHPDNHHRFRNGVIEHIINNGNGTLYYDSDGDEHPNTVGSQKASEEFAPMLNIFYRRWKATAPESPPPKVSEPTPPIAAEATPEDSGVPESPPPAQLVGDVIDDFEAGAPPPDSNGWEAYWDESGATTLACEVDRSVANGGAASLRMDFHIEPASWATCALFFGQPLGLGDTTGVSFDYRAATASLLFDFDAYGGSPDARSSYYHTIETSPESVRGWVNVNLTWEQIVRVDWEENAGEPVNPAEINGFAFGFSAESGAPNSGTIWIDNLRLIRGEIPATAEPELGEVTPQESPTQPVTETTEGTEEAKGGRSCLGSVVFIGLVGLIGLFAIRKRTV